MSLEPSQNGGRDTAPAPIWRVPSADQRCMGPRRGSALLLTLLVTALMMMIVLTFTVVVRLELRKVTAHQQILMARFNARLGMELAIARLQETAGPDTRATATAAAIDSTPRPGTAHWSGVWGAGASTRSDGREPSPVLLDWLVSGRNTAAGAASNTPGSFAPGPDAALLVGPGTLGPLDGPANVSAEDFVRVPVVQTPTLRYAYWVGEENVKARINLADELPETPDAALRRRFAPGAAPVNAMRDLDTLPARDPRWERTLSFHGQDLLYAAAAPWLRRNFHSATLTSATVLSNPATGGLKADLSLAFELDDNAFNRSEFAQPLAPGDPVRINLNQNFRNRAVFAVRDPDLYTADSGANPATDYLSGPSWHYLRDFYRLYREADPVTGTVASRPMSPNRQAAGNNLPNSFIKSNTVAGIDFENQSNALRQRHSNRDKILPTGVEVAPELTRLIFLFGLTLEGGVLHLVIEPVAMLHNPYNVPLEVPGLLALWAMVDQDILVETFHPGAADHQGIAPQDPIYNGNHHAGRGQSLARIMHPDGRDTSFPLVLRQNTGNTSPIRFEPGEIKYFTSGLNRTEVLNRGDLRVFTLVEGLNPATLFQGHGYAFPLEYHRRDGALEVNGPLVLPPDGSVFGVIQAAPGPNGRTEWDVPGLGPYGRIRNGPREYGGLHLYHLRREDLNINFHAMFPPRPEIQSHTQRNGISFADLRELRLWPDELLGGEFYVRFSPKRRFTEAELARVRYFGATDLYLKPLNDDQTRPGNINPSEILTQNNPRAPLAIPWESGGQGINGSRIVQTWSMHNRHLEDGRPDGVIGTGLDGRRGLWGDGLFAQEGGVESVVLYEIPREPLSNLVQLSQAPLSFWSSQPAYAVGSSLASAHIPRDRIWNVSDVAGNVVHSFQFDNAYLLNEALWDGYFFSGISGWNGPGASTASLTGALERFLSDPDSLTTLHPRLRRHGPQPLSLAQAGLDLADYATIQSAASRLRPHNRVAQHVLMEGGFNVNSVSVDAWRAMLSGLSGQGVVRVDAAGRLTLQDAPGRIPFGGPGASRGGDSANDDFSGPRSLTPAEINLLAESIVQEIRERNAARGGPFLSMGAFVNRRLLPAGHPAAAQALSGVLQAAIDRVSDLNADVEGAWGSTQNLSNFPVFGGGADQVRIPFQEPAAFRSSTRQALSRHLDQRAILSVIGTASTVRSDTFRVRSYGATPDGSQAWAETILQRIPEFLDPADPPATPTESLSAVNQRFGRQFRVVSFQWLNEDEI